MKAVCYLDLDGVLVDFVGGALSLHGWPSFPYRREIPWDLASYLGFTGPRASDFWGPMGRKFWANLDWTSEGRELLAHVEGVFGDRVVLLTSPVLTEGCIEGKRDWVARNMPKYSRRLMVGECKSLLAGPGKLLIDDREENVNEFRQEGGHAILIPRPWNSRRDETDEVGNYCLASVAATLTRWSSR